jgi:parallel beta-helix repeat protein
MPRRLALLISNSQYNDARLARLHAPAGDAGTLAAVLENPQIGGFDEVTALLDRPYDEIQHAIVTFFADKKTDDLVLLYFSGHGLVDETRKLYLATVSTNVGLPRARSIAASFIADEMSLSRSKRQILVLDCCHGGAFSRGVKAALNQSVGTENIFSGDGTGRIVMTASDATQYAFEGEQVQGQGVRSVFTKYLVEGLESGAADADNDGAVSIMDWYRYASRGVKEELPSQTPVLWIYGMEGELQLARNPFAARPAPRPEAPSPKQIRTLVVDQLMRGDYDTITAAIANANPGDRILIREGVYDEGLVLDKPLELIGDGQLGEVEIHAYGKRVIEFKASAGVVRNLVLRQTVGEGFATVAITQGRLRLEHCDISSQSGACVAIYNSGTAPIVRYNKIHDSKSAGIFVNTNGQGLIEANEIWGNARAGISIASGANPTVRNNKIHDGKDAGIFVNDKGRGLIEGNQIWGNAEAGIGIVSGSSPTVRNNQIHDGKGNGIYVLENGQGLIEANEIWGNASAGIAITTAASPTVRNNRIHDGKDTGIYALDNGQGLIEANEIWGNSYAGITVQTGASPTMSNNTITKNGDCAIWISKKGGGTFEGNDLRGNAKGSWLIDESSKPLVVRKGNQEDGGGG